MSLKIEFWQFIAKKLADGENVALLLVAWSSGSSPGRQGYKMAVAADGALYGSIGGGVMEVALVERARVMLSEPRAVATGPSTAEIIEQVHQKHSPDASGMICSGRQTVILKALGPGDAATVDAILSGFAEQGTSSFELSNLRFEILDKASQAKSIEFSISDDGDFVYRERLGHGNRLFIIGGGHCSLALSEIAARLDFHVSIFEDRPDLNTMEKNRFADSVTIIDSYEKIAEHIPRGDDVFVVVMTLAYTSDAIVIRKLIDHDVRYIGVLGSKAKMGTLMRELRDEGFEPAKLARIRTPIGLKINSRSPEEIAVSIAAEIIAVKNQQKNSVVKTEF